MWWKLPGDPEAVYEQIAPNVMRRWIRHPHVTFPYKSLDAFLPLNTPKPAEIWRIRYGNRISVVDHVEDFLVFLREPDNPDDPDPFSGSQTSGHILLSLFLLYWEPLEKDTWTRLDM